MRMSINESCTKCLVFILAILSLMTFVGCQSESSKNENGLLLVEEKTTDIFAQLRYTLPDGYSLSEESQCLYDKEKVELSCPATRKTHAGDGSWHSDSAIFTLSMTGEVLSKVPLPTSYVRLGFFQGDTFWYASHAEGDPNNGFSLCCADVETGKLLERIESGDLPQMPLQSNLTVWTIDGDGAFWLAEGGIIRIYSSDLAYLNTVKSPRVFSDLKTDPDGEERITAPSIRINHTSARTEKWNSSKARKESLLC